MALINLIESLLAFNKGHLPLPPTVHLVLHMLTINMQSKNSTCLAPSPTNHPYMCILSFSKGKESQAQSVFSLSIFSSDSTLDGSRLLPLICTGYKWSPNGLMTMKTKPKKHVAPQISTHLNTSEKGWCATWGTVFPTVINQTSDDVMVCGETALHLSNWVSDTY